MYRISEHLLTWRTPALYDDYAKCSFDYKRDATSRTPCLMTPQFLVSCRDASKTFPDFSSLGKGCIWWRVYRHVDATFCKSVSIENELKVRSRELNIIWQTAWRRANASRFGQMPGYGHIAESINSKILPHLCWLLDFEHDQNIHGHSLWYGPL